MKYFLTLLFSFSSLFAAGPLAHLYLAERYCIAHAIQDEKWGHEFVIGSLFPDIRYLIHLSREETHLAINQLDEIKQAANAFEAGMLFHAWVDTVREAYVIESGIYQALVSHPKEERFTLLKFIEDEVIAERYSGIKWAPIFDFVLPQEEAFGLREEEIEWWHILVQHTFYYKPSYLIWGCSFFKERAFGISSSTLYSWSYLLPKLAQESLFQSHTNKLITHIESHF